MSYTWLSGSTGWAGYTIDQGDPTHGWSLIQSIPGESTTQPGTAPGTSLPVDDLRQRRLRRPDAALLLHGHADPHGAGRGRRRAARGRRPRGDGDGRPSPHPLDRPAGAAPGEQAESFLDLGSRSWFGPAVFATSLEAMCAWPGGKAAFLQM